MSEHHLRAAAWQVAQAKQRIAAVGQSNRPRIEADAAITFKLQFNQSKEAIRASGPNELLCGTESGLQCW